MQKHLGIHLSQIMPGIETVSLKSRQSADQTAFTTYSGLRARRRRMTKDETAQADIQGSRLGTILASRRTLIFEFYQDLLTAANAPAPKVRDQVVDASNVTYTIVQPVQYQLLQQIYACLCEVNVP